MLIVEDEQPVADLYVAWLEDQYRVRTAHNGEEALERLDPTIDVVLLDRRMPGLSGDAVLGRIRELDGEYQVAMVTAMEPDFDVLKLDFDEYLTKPLSREDLQEVVEELLTRGTFEADIQRALSLAAKKTALENEKSPAELRTNTAYDALTSELAEQRDQVNQQLTQLVERDSGSYFPYSRSRIALDSILIGTIAVALVFVHLGLPDVRERLLAGGSPGSDLVVSYLLTFVHLNDVHLIGNTIGYLFGAVLTYALCLRIRAVRWFYLTVPVLLTLLPLGTVRISTALFELLTPDTETVLLGFSTVVAGFVGFAFLALLFVARAIYDHRTVFFIGAFVLLVLVDSVLWVNGGRLMIATGVATVLVLALILGDSLEDTPGSPRAWKRFLERLGTLLVATSFFTAFGLGLFPVFAYTSPAQAANATNVFGHVLGAVLGFVVAFTTAFIADMFPIRERLQREGFSLPERLL